MFAGLHRPHQEKTILEDLKKYPFELSKYEPKVIDYADSPNGRAYVGHAKSPYMKTATGRGFQGVLLQDETRQFVQCYECGKWMKSINGTHLRSCNDTVKNNKQYKEKYGLSYTHGLVSDETSRVYAENAMKNLDRTVQTNQLHKIRRQANRARGDKSKKSSIEYQNKHATCPLQLLTRLVNFINTNHELPRNNNRGKNLFMAIYRRYGSYGHGLQQMGLPYMGRDAGFHYYAFPDGDVLKFDITDYYQKEALYKAMVAKCPVLTDPNLEKYLT